MFKLRTTTEITNEQVSGLLCTGWEGGMTTQWARVINRKAPKSEVIFTNDKTWHSYPLYSYPLGSGGFVTIEDTETGKLYSMNRATIRAGLKIMAEKYPRHFQDFINDNEDAVTGDVFIQCCVLRDVLYG